MPDLGLSGVVLVGGRSRRMGRDKARLLWRGQPLWRRQIRILERAGAHPVRLALRARQKSFGESSLEIRDRHPNAGPMSGLQAALEAAAGSEWVAVLAVDMPRIDADWFRRLRARCRPGVGAVRVARNGFEPLAAIYPTAALSVVTRRLRRRKLALQALLAELTDCGLMVPLRLSKADLTKVANWNEPRDVRVERVVPNALGRKTR
ncbi:MAG TPA: molybdenum cofactor guanylyltransferase [Candidatus Didemnitutus sp.]|nr:molybdenum cofactor guanylyltransferase [Candidatus Didemnitutus sp.]